MACCSFVGQICKTRPIYKRDVSVRCGLRASRRMHMASAHRSALLCNLADPRGSADCRRFSAHLHSSNAARWRSTNVPASITRIGSSSARKGRRYEQHQTEAGETGRRCALAQRQFRHSPIARRPLRSPPTLALRCRCGEGSHPVAQVELGSLWRPPLAAQGQHLDRVDHAGIG